MPEIRDFYDAFQLAALAVFVLLFLVRTFQLQFARGVNPFAIGVGSGPFRTLLEIVFLLAFALWAWEVLVTALHVPQWGLLPSSFYQPLFASAPIRALGVVLVTAGLTLYALTLRSFGPSRRTGVELSEEGELVTRGIYSLSRNPIFLFLDLYFAGTFFIAATPVFLGAAVAVVLGLHYEILEEEEFLQGAHGAPYSDYRARTSRYFRFRAKK